MKLIPLTQGKFTQVDDEDFESLNKWKWSAHKMGNSYYADRGIYVNGKCKTVLMHRQIMNAEHGIIIDHKFGDGLNNQKSNLRKATRSQNNANRKKITGKIYLGVAFEKDRQMWTARIRKDGKGYRLGQFNTAEEAAFAYNKKAIELHGEFANLNVISVIIRDKFVIELQKNKQF